MIAIYQLDFLTPGIKAWLAISLKQMRHSPNSLIYPRFLPQRKQRLRILVENFGFLFALAINDFLAMLVFNRKAH